MLLVWPLVIEGLLSSLLGAAGVNHPVKYMPYQSGIQLANRNAGIDAELPPRIPAGLYFGTVTGVLLLLGAALTNHRDA